MRRTCLDEIYQLAKTDERVMFIGSDIGAGTLDAFHREMPERFLMEGISEAHLVGMMAGLAMEDKIPYMNTIATFLTRRCFEQVLLDAGLHHLKLRLVGSGGGAVYAPLGPTHLALEDLAIMRAIPGMTVVAPCDAEEMKRLMPLTLDYEGPMYIRLAKGGDPVVSRPEMGFEIGKAILLERGKDALVVSTGITTQLALEARRLLAQKSIDAGVLHMPTLKPFDREALLSALEPVRAVVSVEEHQITGGLGSAVSEVIAEAGFDRPKRFARIGFKDLFPEGYGSQEGMMRDHGISAQNTALTLERFLHS